MSKKTKALYPVKFKFLVDGVSRTATRPRYTNHDSIKFITSNPKHIDYLLNTQTTYNFHFIGVYGDTVVYCDTDYKETSKTSLPDETWLKAYELQKQDKI